jgi:hypothetical protein
VEDMRQLRKTCPRICASCLRKACKCTSPQALGAQQLIGHDTRTYDGVFEQADSENASSTSSSPVGFGKLVAFIIPSRAAKVAYDTEFRKCII